MALIHIFAHYYSFNTLINHDTFNFFYIKIHFIFYIRSNNYDVFDTFIINLVN